MSLARPSYLSICRYETISYLSEYIEKISNITLTPLRPKSFIGTQFKTCILYIHSTHIKAFNPGISISKNSRGERVVLDNFLAFSRLTFSISGISILPRLKSLN